MKRSVAKWLPSAIGFAIGALCTVGFFAGLFGSSSFRVNDRFFLPRDPADRIVIVAINDASLAKIGRWPWPRTVHAELITKITEAGAGAIGYDVNFPESSDAESDAALARAIRAAGNVVLPVELPLQIVGGKLLFEPGAAVRSIPLIQSAAKAVGHTNTPQDADGIVRRLPLSVAASDGSSIRSFSYEMAALALPSAPALTTIPGDRFARMTVNYPGAPGRVFKTVAASDILQGTADLSVFRNAIVFVGATAQDLHDQQNVPTSRGVAMSGVEIHASAFDTIASRAWLRPVSGWVEALSLLLIGLMLGLIVPRFRARVSASVALVLWIGWIIVAFFAFDRGFLVDIIWPSLVIVFAYGALLLERWIATESQRKTIRGAFSQYVSPSVVETLLRDPSKLKLGGERRRMTVLFSDLRGFTTLSEGLSPEQLVEVLNKYLHEMTQIVFEEQGVLDKYIGDAVMAFWNAPLDQPDHAIRAVRTAVRMRDRLKEMNESHAFPPGIVLKVGIGMNTGEMVVGNIGGEMRYDYTVIGDSVNLASRTESLCKEYGVEIIVTESTRKELGDAFLIHRLDRVAVKGKKEPVALFHVMGLATQLDAAKARIAEQYDAALQAYFDREFTQSLALCEAILKDEPEHGPTKNLIGHVKTYLETPPPEGWDGTWVMTKK